MHRFPLTASTMLLKIRPTEGGSLPEEKEPELNAVSKLICPHIKKKAKRLLITAKNLRNDRNQDGHYLRVEAKLFQK